MHPPSPPPPYVMCCRVMLRASTHLKHGTPIMMLSVCIRKFQLFWGSSFFFVVVVVCEVFTLFLLPFHSALPRKLCLGECRPPSSNFSQKPHALFPLHAHAHMQTPTEIDPPACLIPILSHPCCTHSETHSRSLKAHTSTNPSQFLQIPAGPAEPGQSGSDAQTSARSLSDDLHNRG